MRKLENYLYNSLKFIICVICSFILCFCCALIPKADIYSMGSELLNDNNIEYYYEVNEITISNEVTSSAGLYINYIDYSDFYFYASKLNYINYQNLSCYFLFSYNFIDANLDEWNMTALIVRSYDETISSYDYELIFYYNLPQLGIGEDVLITMNGLNTQSTLYGLVSNFISTYNVSLQQVNLLKLVCLIFFTDDNYVLDVELTPNDEVISLLGSQNVLIKNLFSGLPFTQPEISTALFYDYYNELIETREVPTNFEWVNIGYNNSNMPYLDNINSLYFVGWEYSRDFTETNRNSFISVTQGYQSIYFYPKYINTILNGTYTSNKYFTLGNIDDVPIRAFNSQFNFSSNGQSFSRLKFTFNGDTFYLYYDDLLVAFQSRNSNDFIHWTNLKYSNITFDNSYPNDINAYYFIIRNFHLGSISVSDISGYYYFNENPIGTNSSNNTFRFLFISNGELFNSLSILSNGSVLYDNQIVYNGDTNSWVNEKFRLININKTQIESEQMQILLSNGVFSYVDVNGDYEFSDVLFSIADIPVRIMSQLLDVSIFGVSLFTALCGIITILLVAFVIKKFL